MKTISIYLNDANEQRLNKIMKLNNCSITDVIVTGLISLAKETEPVIFKEKTVRDAVKHAILDSEYKTVNNFCRELEINQSAMWALCGRIQKGGSVGGFGTANRSRNKNDDRLFRTHTAYIANCLLTKCGLDIEKL